MILNTIFSGGCSDSLMPRKVHLLDPSTHRAICGQAFSAKDRVETSDIESANFRGSETCSKCFRKMAALIDRLTPNVES